MMERTVTFGKGFQAGNDDPALQYSTVFNIEGPSTPGQDSSGDITCFVASEKLLAIGRLDGRVDLIDCEGDTIKTFREHRAPVRGLSFDAKSEYLASCCSSGKVFIFSLYSEQDSFVDSYSVGKELTSIAIDPRYANRKTKEVIVGDKSGNVYFLSKGWLGTLEKVLFRGKYPIRRIAWSGTMVAWSSSTGVRVYNTGSHLPVGTVPLSEYNDVSLLWVASGKLFIGQGKQVWSVASTCMNGSLATTDSSGDGERTCFSKDLVFESDHGTVESLGQGIESIFVLTRGSDSYTILKLCDEAPAEFLHGGELPFPEDVAVHLSGSVASALNTSCDTGEPMFFIHMPQAIVAAKPLDAVSRLEWLCENHRFQEALALTNSTYSLRMRKRDVGEKCMSHLIGKGEYKVAGVQAPQLLFDSTDAWERWATKFGQSKKLHLLAPNLPYKDVPLSVGIYELAIKSCFQQKEYEIAAQILDTWPVELYDENAVYEMAKERLTRDPDSTGLLQISRILCTKMGMHQKAMEIMMRLSDVSVFDYIRDHKLFWAASVDAATLMEIDEVRATKMLVEYHDEAPPLEVIQSMCRFQEGVAKADTSEENFGASLSGRVKGLSDIWAKRLYKYLEWLRRRDSSITDFDTILVEMCALYEPENMMTLLQSSNSYSLDQALDACVKHGLVAEQVFVLGRMGSNIDALHLIVEKMQDVSAAVRFANECMDVTIWEELMHLASKNGSWASELLEFAGDGINPGHLLQSISEDMCIPDLKDKIHLAAQRVREELSMQQLCQINLEDDCSRLLFQLYQKLCRSIEILEWANGSDTEDEIPVISMWSSH